MSADHPDLTGRLLDGRYRLGDVLGTGGMGSVHRADDLRLQRVVAVKVLRHTASDDVSRSRMRSEARLAGSLHHVGTAQVYDYVESSESLDGSAYIVMEHVSGHSLAELLRESGPLPTEQVMSVVVQVAEALAAAHAGGVVHRDVKPGNIMLTPAGRTVLVDFGIARSDASEPLTATGSLIGTADYLSPEQAAGRSAGPLSDLYSLGVVAHQCLTGTSPFKRESQIATAVAHLQDPAPPLDDAIPAGARDLVSRLTAKDPADRPQSAAEVARLAAAVGADPTIDLPPTLESPGPVTRVADPPTVALTGSTAAAPVRSRRRVAVLSGVGLVALLLVVLGVDQLRSDGPPIVPDLVGLQLDDATTAARADELSLGRTTVDVPGKDAGEVVKQSPAAGSTAPADGRVTVQVASGKVRFSADSIVGSTYAEAAARLEKLGLVVRRQPVSRTSGVGTVVALSQSGRVADGSTVLLSVAVAAPTPAVAATPATSGGPSAKGPGQGKGPGKSKDKKK